MLFIGHCYELHLGFVKAKEGEKLQQRVVHEVYASGDAWQWSVLLYPYCYWFPATFFEKLSVAENKMLKKKGEGNLNVNQKLTEGACGRFGNGMCMYIFSE